MLVKFQKYNYFIIVFLIWIISSAAKLKFNGLVFGFDYGIYQPDGKFYTYRTLDWINRNPLESANQVVNWYKFHGFKMNIFRVEDLVPESSSAYPVISHRILYPLLSIPFVKIFGIPGMLAIPVISFGILLIVVQKIAIKMKKPWFGIGLVFLLSTSPTVLRWMIVNCTDSLLAGLFALVVWTLIKIDNYPIKKTWGILFILILSTSATRFVLPIWFGVAVILFLNKRTILSAFVITSSTVFSIPALIAQTPTALLPGEKQMPVWNKLFELPWSFLKVITIDFLEFAVLDRILLVILIAALIISFLKIKIVSSQYFLVTFITTYVIGAINGTLGVNFRYQMPLLAFCAWVLLDSTKFSINRKLIP